MTEIRDLDEIVPLPKRVRFGGQEFDIPADIPMEIFLRINQAGRLKDEDGNPDQLRQLEALTDSIADLFNFEREEAVDFTAEEAQKVRDHVRKTLGRRGVRYAFTLISAIYKVDEDAEDPTEVIEGQAQPIAASNGTTSSSTLPSQTTPKQTTPPELDS